jgi:SAM-dependent methyltransferase
VRLFDARDYISGDCFSIQRCRDCQIAFTRPVPGDMTRYYPSAYYGDGSKRFPAIVVRLQRALYSRRVRAIQNALGRTGRVLDVGCGPGFLLREFRQSGWDVHGTEFSDQSAAHARDRLHLPVSVGDVTQLHFPAQSFDAVVMWHVLEHTPEPAVAIAEVSRLLRPGGVFLCAVPNFGSLEARIARDKWFHLDVPRHLSHFTVPALGNLLAGNGLSIIRKSFFALEYDYFSFTQSALNRLGLRQNLLYNLLRGTGAKVLQPSALWQKLVSLALAAPLGIVSVLATTGAALCRNGATVTVLARRT